MGLFDAKIDELYQLMPDDIDRRIRIFEKRFDFENQNYDTDRDLKEIFEYLQLLIFDRRTENMIFTLNSIKPHIEKALDREPDNLTFLEYLTEWNILAMRFVLPEKASLAELPYYQCIRELTEQQTGLLKAKELQTRLNIINYYNNWLNTGGDPNVLTDEDYALLEDLVQNTEKHISLTVALWKEDNDIVPAVVALRGLFRFYSLNEKPNEAVRTLKEILDIIPIHPEYLESDSADVLTEIGMIFYKYKKYSVAAPYFEKALNIYADLGEDFEMHAAQTETFLAECQAAK